MGVLRSRAAVLVFVAIIASASSFAQVPDPVTAARAPKPGYGLIGNGAEIVNPADGSLSFNLPIQTPAGRQLSMPFGFRYSSNEQFHLGGDHRTLYWTNNQRMQWQEGGWSYDLPVLTARVRILASYYTPPYPGAQPTQLHQCLGNQNHVFRGLDGKQYNLSFGGVWPDPEHSDGTESCHSIGMGAGGSYHGVLATAPTDWTSWPSQPPITITDQSGTTYQFPSQNVQGSDYSWDVLADTITDRNGNRIAAKNSPLSGLPTGYTDTLGRQIVSWTGFGNEGDQVAVSGLQQNIVLHWSSKTAAHPSSGQNVGGTNTCYVDNSLGSNAVWVVTQVDLPNGQNYRFEYDQSAYGHISRIVFPGGGYVRYEWGLDTSSDVTYGVIPAIPGSGTGQTDCYFRFDAPAVKHRYVSFDGQTEVLTQQFDYQTDWKDEKNWLSKVTTVTTTDNVAGTTEITKYTYTSVPAEMGGNNDTSWRVNQVPVEQSVSYQDGSGNPLKTVNKTWKNAFAMNGEQTILDNPDNALGTTTLRCYDENEQVTSLFEYGFRDEGDASADPSCVSSAGLNSEAIGPLLRQTATTYQTFDSTHIVNRPQSITTSDGSGNTVAQTTFTYTDTVTASGAQTNLVAPPGAHRGNINTISRWLHWPGESDSWPTTTYSWYDTGQLATMTDAKSNPPTQYSYTDDYSSCGGSAPPSGTTGAYLTEVTFPTTNGVAHRQNFCYSYPEGQLRSSKDQNGKTTSYLYNDILRRLTEIDSPDGGVTTYAYTDAPGSVSIETKSKISNQATWTDSFELYDGLMHPIAQSTKNANGSWDRVDTCYDGHARIRFKSYPFSGSSGTAVPSCSDHPGDTLSYDPLGRASSVMHSDQSAILTSYSGRATQVQDEGNGTQRVQRISQVDSLGRLRSVCEVSSTALTVGPNKTPSACSQDISATATGFLTTYDYDLYGLIEVNQPGLSSRTFEYDSLSRLRNATNPESGRIHYEYDSNGNVVDKEAPAPNQPADSTARVTTYYCYDSLNRVTAKSYTDQSCTSPVATFSYDKAMDGLQISNPVGRLVKSATSAAATVNSYDEVGRIKDQWQCTPQKGCGTGFFAATYSHDFLGNLTSSVFHGVKLPTETKDVTLTYAPDPVGRLASLTSSLQDVQHPGALLADVKYNAFGLPTTQSLGNGAAQTNSYDERGRISGSHIDLGQTRNATGSSGSVTISGTEKNYQQQTQAAASGTGSFTIYGSSTTFSYCPGGPMTCTTIPNTGTVSVTVSGCPTWTGNYAPGTTSTYLAGIAASSLNSCSLVTATVSGSTVTLTARATGASTNYGLSSSCTKDSRASSCDFYASLSGSKLSGGRDAVSTTVYDSGKVTVTVNGTAYQSTYGSTSSSNSIAADLAGKINGSSIVRASSSGSTINIASRGTGSATNYSLSVSSSSNDSTHFSPPSFNGTRSGATLTGGQDGQTPTVLYSYSIVNYTPNGNVQSVNDSVNGNWTYTYDQFNRLLNGVASNAATGCSWAYDRFGNSWSQSAYGSGNSCLSMNHTFNASNNRIDGYAYDPAGNVTNDGCFAYTYDQENRLIDATRVGTSCPGNGATYIYDAEGRRVEKATKGGDTVDYIHDPAGRQIAEVSSTGVWSRIELYAGGAHVATYRDGTTYFNHSDWLGTERKRTKVDGSEQERCTNLPFGDNQQCTGPETSPMHFTGKERDSESGLDYFGARYYGSNTARFLTPDPMMIMKQKLIDPQQWNMYSYTRNNPLRFSDPTGKYTCKGTTDECARMKAAYDEIVKAAAAAKGDAAKQLNSVLQFLGKPGEANYVTVSFGRLSPGTLGEANTTTSQPDALGKTYKNTDLKFDLHQIDMVAAINRRTPAGKADPQDDAGMFMHEGTHGRDQFPSGHNPRTKPAEHATEMNAYRNQSYVFVGLGFKSMIDAGLSASTEAERNAAISAGADRSTAAWCEQGGGC